MVDSNMESKEKFLGLIGAEKKGSKKCDKTITEVKF